MELVETLEINGEEREIADAYARGQIAANAQNIATNTEGIAGLNNNLSQLEIDLKMLGYTVPKEMPVQNYVDSDGVFHQRVGRVDLGSLSWNRFAQNETVYLFNANFTYGKSDKNANGVCRKYSTFDTNNGWGDMPNNSIGYTTTRIRVRDDSYTGATDFKNAMKGVYLYYELATENTIKVDGNEAVTKVNDSLSVIGKCKNLLNPTLATTTQDGVTCTNNGDGTYTLNGTANKTTTFAINNQIIPVGTYKLVGCPSGGSLGSSYVLSISSDANRIDTGSGKVTDIRSADRHVFIVVYANCTCNNVVFKPMLTTNLNATYDDFEPYTGDGETLTEDVASLKNDLSECRKKSDITTNETLIGTFNGKNYYRRLFTGIGASGSSVTVNVGEKIEIYNYYGRAYMYGQSGASAAKYPIPNKNYYIESQNISETSFQLTMPTSSDMRKIDLVIEYTKVDE